ncbi:MAG TPA: 23S rRNA (adenine(2030)-N(6))-methyltransferase RlmJ [Acetobacteraceae bacterium]|nr:23S rRNA (adenine(2030)-N(6))-methyltransferase RlmJ [Acetobacteraceae bacterium]
MNYRHAYHAGNFADCHKHAILVWLLAAMARKPARFFVLDTHAGAGWTALGDGPAARTGEWRRGIARLLDTDPPALADYLGLVRRLGLYPGSPMLARELLRPGDRLAACELHPEDATALRRRFAGDPAVAIHHRDGYEALRALLPPPERRALVLIDPPYEAADEAERVVAGLAAARARVAGGVIAAWYPIKHAAPVRALHTAVVAAGLRDVAAAELRLRAPDDPTRLNGSGVLLVNPPFRFEDELPPLQEALLAALADGDAGQGAFLQRLSDE